MEFLGTKRLLIRLTNSSDLSYCLLCFYCPPCKDWHSFRVSNSHKDEEIEINGMYGKQKVPAWYYNGNPDCPTFSPSLRYLTEPYCHLTITDGRIQYHSDSPKSPNLLIDMEPFDSRWDIQD